VRSRLREFAWAMSEALFVNDARLKEAKGEAQPDGRKARAQRARCVCFVHFFLCWVAAPDARARHAAHPWPTSPVFPRLCTDPDDPNRITDETRALGMVVCRGTQVLGRC
jgi:hypothetical protein